MLGEKGSTHVDWAISLGIFLVYVLSMFILIQPGIEPIQRNDQLISIVEDNLIEEITAELTKTPVKIEGISGPARITITDSVPFDGSAYHAAVVDGNVYYAAASENYLEYDTPDAEQTVYIVESGKFQLAGEQAGFESKAPTSYVIGTAEKLKGTSLQLVDSLKQRCSDNYEQVKSDWKFPPNKMFSVRMKTGEGYEYICHKEEPYGGANVFAKEIKIPVIGEDARIKDNLIFNIRVW